MIRTVILAGALLTAMCARGQDYSFKPAQSAALNTKEGQGLLKQCSRSSPAGVTGFWEVGPTEIALLEKNFRKVRLLKGGKMIGNFETTVYQYLGVIIKGQRCIYISAGGCEDWKRQPCIMCDGGWSFWGVLFNVPSQEFSELSFNGDA